MMNAVKIPVAWLVFLICLMKITASSGQAYVKIDYVKLSGPDTVEIGQEAGYEAKFYGSSGVETFPPETIEYYEWYGPEFVWTNNWMCKAKWTREGSHDIEYGVTTLDNYYGHTLTVTVGPPPAPPHPNTNFTINAECEQTIVSRNTDPPSGVSWFWQTSASGTSTTLGSNKTIKRTTSGQLYLRARTSTSPYSWSSSSQNAGNITVKNTPAPGTATDAHIFSNTETAVRLSVGEVSGATSYRWYYFATGGSPIEGVNTNSYTTKVSKEKDYYVEAVMDNCVSTTRTKVSAHFHPEPIVLGTTTSLPAYLTVNNYSYDSYIWLKDGNPIAGASNNSFHVDEPGAYSVRVTKGTSGYFDSEAVQVNHFGDSRIKIAGPSEINVNETVQYQAEFTNHEGNPIPNPFAEGYFWGLDIVSGNLNENYFPSRSEYSCTLQPRQEGSYYIEYEIVTTDDPYLGTAQYSAYKKILVCGPTPYTPDALFSITKECGQSVVMRLSEPPSCYDWYWQTSPSGTSTTLGNSASVVRSTADPVYLRARTKDAPHTWSAASQNVGEISISSSRPIAPTASVNAELIAPAGVSIPLAVSPVEGATSYRWYTQPTGGDPIPGVHTSSYTPKLSQAQHYYVEALIEGCPSATRRKVEANVYPVPVTESTHDGIIYSGESVIISVVNFAYDSYVWLNDGTEIAGATGSSYQATKPGVYSVKVSKGTASYTSSGKSIIDEAGIMDRNYIKTFTFQAPISSVQNPDNLSVEEVKLITRFYDGLGRPGQTVVKQGSSTKKDIVQPRVYDEFGREAIKYLPYTAGTSGIYKVNALEDIGSTAETQEEKYRTGDQYMYYQNGELLPSDHQPYAATVFEPSPLNRILEQGSPGQDWQPGSGHTVKTAYLTNEEDEVILWKYENGDNSFGQIIPDAYYDKGQLYVRETKDEENNTVKEYTDKSGQLLLKDVRDKENMSHYTYYIYDDHGNLRVVLPPAFTDTWLENGGFAQDSENYKGYTPVNQRTTIYDTNENTSFFLEKGKMLILGRGFRSGPRFHIATEQAPAPLQVNLLRQYAFFYHYDHRDRLVEKHLPGGGTTYMVYDKWDRLVLTQDEVQREKDEWHYTKYDQLNRPIITGLWEKSGSRLDLQAEVSSSSNRFDVRGNSQIHGYSLNNCFPNSNINTDLVLTAYYYDDYDFKFLVEDSESSFGFVPKEGFQQEAFRRVKGQLTGTKTKVLDGSGYLYSVDYYDDRYRLIQNVSNNQQHDYSGLDRRTNAYDFTGRLIQSQHEHEGVEPLTIFKEYDYDHAGRLTNSWQSINGAERTLLARNEYNELGELVDKKLHSEDEGGTFMQSVDYRYNIRGWLTHINNSSLSRDANNDDIDDFFGLELKYNTGLQTGAGTASYNGNITEALWKNTYDHKQRAYAYTYDGLNRLENATYKAYGSGWSSDPENNRYNVSLSYDASGNISGLNRGGQTGERQYGEMDILGYRYNGNQLTKVTESGNPDYGFKNISAEEEDFSYDANGNLTHDKARGLTTHYNFLNLPERIDLAGDTTIYNIYDAEARKLGQKIMVKGTAISSQEYVGEIVYEKGGLSFISQQEGKVLPHEDGWEYQYYLKDHLDNVRITFTAKPDSVGYLATMEREQGTEEDRYFDGFGNTRVPVVEELNHTPLEETGLSPEAVRLNTARTGEAYIPGISLAVLPGDKVEAKVWAKYLDLRRSELNPNALIAALAGAGGYTVSVDGGGTATISDGAGSTALLGGSGAGDVPQAFLNYYLFDQDFQLIDMGYAGLSEEAAVDPENLGKAHQELGTPLIEILQAGYLRIELSHDATEDVDIYFDDLTVSHQQTPILSADDYYPFGLSIAGTAFSRNDPNYRGRVSDANTLPEDYVFRQYDPLLGRFTSVDPLGELTLEHSPYHYGLNNPVSNTDPLGLTSDNPIEKLIEKVKEMFKKKTGAKVGKGVYATIGVRKRSGNRSRGNSRSQNNNKKSDNSNSNEQKERVQTVYLSQEEPSYKFNNEPNSGSNDMDAGQQQQRKDLQGLTASLNMQPSRDYMSAFKQAQNSNPTALGQYYKDFEREEFTKSSTPEGKLQAYKQYLMGRLPFHQVLGLTAQRKHVAQTNIPRVSERNKRGEAKLSNNNENENEEEEEDLIDKSEEEVQLFLRQIRDSYKYGTTIEMDYKDGEVENFKLGQIEIESIKIEIDGVFDQELNFQNLINGNDKASHYFDDDDLFAIKFGDIELKVKNQSDRDKLWDFVTGKSEEHNFAGDEPITLDGKTYSLEYVVNEMEKIRIDLQQRGLYDQLDSEGKLLLDIPIIEWKENMRYSAIFQLNWFKDEGKINFEDFESSSLVTSSTDRLFDRELYSEALQELQDSGNFIVSGEQKKSKSRLIENIMNELPSKYDSFELNLGSGFVDDEENNFSYFMSSLLTREELADDLLLKNQNDFAGSFGTTRMTFYFTGSVTRTAENMAVVNVAGMYYRIRDSFDFNDGGDVNSQELGSWVHDIYETKSPELIGSGNSIDNESYNTFTNTTGVGKDFLIMTDFIKVEKTYSGIFINLETGEYEWIK